MLQECNTESYFVKLLAQAFCLLQVVITVLVLISILASAIKKLVIPNPIFGIRFAN